MPDARQVALLRGVNVGRGNRIAMADLRALVEALGFGDVRTLLNSGNVVYRAPRVKPAAAAARIEAALRDTLGVKSRVLALDAGEVATILAENPLVAEAAEAPSRLLVTMLADPAADLPRLAPLVARAPAPERMALGSRAAYLWCPPGISASEMPDLVAKAHGDRATARNWATMTKIAALLEE